MREVCLDIRHLDLVSTYPEGDVADAIEEQIALGLPPIGLHDGLTQQERLAVYARAIEDQREAFTGNYGDMFGQERRSVPRAQDEGRDSSFVNFFQYRIEAA